MPADELPLPALPSPYPCTSFAPPPPPDRLSSLQSSIAPLWHTVVLIAIILSISFFGSGKLESAARAGDPHRLAHYALSGGMELILVAFVYLGLRLRKLPFSALFGDLPRGLNNITKEAGVALLFWIVSMVVLASVALTWNGVQTAIYHHHQQQSPSHQTNEESPQKQQIEMARKLMELAPANAAEITAWAALCLIVGFCEETIFRGYLQLQGITILRSTAAGLIFSAIVFGCAHGYQGIRGMFLITIYGALFGGIALLRRNLFPGMLAHSWHDFATGMLLAFIRETHLLDHLPIAS